MWCWACAFLAAGHLSVECQSTSISRTVFGLVRKPHHRSEAGYRAWSRAVLERLPLLHNSDDFVFDNQILVQSVFFGFRIGEVSCPTKYFPEASSINFRRSVIYGIGVLKTAVQFRAARMGMMNSPLFADAVENRLPILSELDVSRSLEPAK